MILTTASKKIKYPLSEEGQLLNLCANDWVYSICSGCKKLFARRGREVFSKQKRENQNQLFLESPALTLCQSCMSKTTNLQKYGVENPSQSKAIQLKKEETTLKHYGVKHPFSAKEVQQQIQNTLKEKYEKNPEAKKDRVRKTKKTMLEKYGHEYPLQCPEIKEQVKRTNRGRYGFENPNQSPIIRGKVKQTNLERYGVTSPANQKQVKKRMQQDVWLSTFSRLLKFQEQVTPLFSEKDFKGVHEDYSWKCSKCGSIFSDSLVNGHVPRCPVCYPCSSQGIIEKEIFDWASTLSVPLIRNTRKIIAPLELDIYFPINKIAIEFNELMWHSEAYTKGARGKKYHINKTLSCEKQGIQLIHIFEDEWLNKQEIVKSIIKAKLGLFDVKIGARECLCSEVSASEAKKFLEKNHIQGAISSMHRYGLYHKDVLVSILCISKNRFYKKGLEITRFANKTGYSIIGALPKLWAAFLKYQDSKNTLIIRSYADKRYFTGAVNSSIGFKHIQDDAPNYYYLNKKYQQRENRLKYQKHKLKSKLTIFDSNLTEWENMQLNGYDRIWDCGVAVWEYIYAQR